MGKIVLEDFNESNGYYKVNLAYLNKEQVEKIENLVSKWNPTDEDIKNCIAMCLTDVNEQRFKDYGTNLRDCLAWLEKQGTSYTKRDVDDAYVEGMAFAKNELEKQKSSWSEDDEKMKDLIISVLEVNHSKGIFKVGLRAIRTEEIVSWLKSLKQRYTWKPGDEQMEALEHFIIHHNGSTNYAKDLEELRIQLKKLKGE